MDKLNLRTLIETGTFLTLTSRWRTYIPGNRGQYISCTLPIFFEVALKKVETYQIKNSGLRLTDTFTDAHCFDSNNTIIQGWDLTSILTRYSVTIALTKCRNHEIYGQ